MPYANTQNCRVWWFPCPVCGKQRMYRKHSGWLRATKNNRACIRCASIRSAPERGDRLRYGGEGKTYIKEGGRHQHRKRMEEHLGRKLESWEHVHHKDENPRNNDLSNLEVLTATEHVLLHMSKRKEKAHDLHT